MIRDITGAAAFAGILPAFPDANRVTRFHFDSVEAFARHVPEARPSGAWNSGGWTASERSTATPTMQAARALALQGWPAGAATVERIAARVALLSPTLPRVARWDVAGAVASVPRHLAGNPLAMRRIVRDETRRRPVLTLLADAGCGFTTTAAAMVTAAGIAAALVDRLEAAGFRVEVLCGLRSGKLTDGNADHRNAAHNRSEIVWRAKAPEEPADASRLAVALGHPSMLRRLCVAAWAMAPEVEPALGALMGAPIAFARLSDRPADTFILPGPDAYPSDEMRAFRVALNTLRNQGCPGIPEDAAAA